MFPNLNHQVLKKSKFRHRSRRPRVTRREKKSSVKLRQPSFTLRFQQSLVDLQQSGSLFLSYSTAELEPICQQLALEKMASSSTASSTLLTTCPFVCLFCQNLIYEPITLYCGHTYCEQCVKDEELSSSSQHCPRCSKDIQGQIQSSIVYARDTNFSKNHFLKQILERSETLKYKWESILLCRQAQNECAYKNYQQAIDIYSQILDKNDDEHLALYGRAKTYVAVKQLGLALDDIECVIRLKPQWAKGYYCRSEILFQMKRFKFALLSSLQGLTIDPEDQTGKQIMAQHLHTVLHDNNDRDDDTTMTTELDTLPSSNDKADEVITSGASTMKLRMCKSSQSNSCLCTLFDFKDLRARDFECSICVNLLWFPVTTPCGHVFCRECLIRSVDNTQALCPMCKGSLEQFFPILIQSHVNKSEVISHIIETYLPNEFNERRQLDEQEKTQSLTLPVSLMNHSEATIFEIPIFVCVLTLPFSTCPLHVFEPRYRLMMRRTTETPSRTFGMCKYDEQNDLFTDCGTLLYIRGLVYTQDGRSIVDTIGRQRFRVLSRGTKDSYHTARVQLIQDHPIEQEEFDELFQLNRTIYDRVHAWFDQLDAYRRTLISRQFEGYPSCDDLTHNSTDGPSWSWIMLNVLPIEPDLQYTALTSQSYRTRLQMISDVLDFLSNQNSQQQTTATSVTEEA